MSFNWNDYPVMKTESESSFNWNDHPVVQKQKEPSQQEGFFSGRHWKDPAGDSHQKISLDSVMQDAPGLGMMAGGTLGGASGLPGAILGAGLGASFGAGAKNLYNNYIHPEIAPKSELEHFQDSANHAAQGMVLEGIGGVASKKLLNPVGRFIKHRLEDSANAVKGGAERLAFRALGPFKRQVNQNKDRIHEIGRTALDEKIIKLPPGSAETIESRAKEASAKAGEELGKLVDELLVLEKQTKGKFSTGSVKRLGDYLRSKLVKPSQLPQQLERNAYFEKKINELTDGNKRLNFDQIRQMKLDANKLINWNRLKDADIPLEEQYLRTLSTALKESEEYGAASLEKAWYGQNSNKFPSLKKKYGNLEEAEGIASNRADAQRANQILGLKSAVYGAAGAGLGGEIGHKVGGVPGAIVGSVIGGGIGGIGNHLAKNYGSQFSAVVLDKAAKLLAKSPSLFSTSKKYPHFIPYLLQSIEDKEKKYNK